MPKLYLLDSGIINFALGNFGQIALRPNLGSFIENFVFNEIIKYKPIQYRVYFWRTKLGTEIDFILEGNDELIPVEVKWLNMTSHPSLRISLPFLRSIKISKNAVIINRISAIKFVKKAKMSTLFRQFYLVDF